MRLTIFLRTTTWYRRSMRSFMKCARKTRAVSSMRRNGSRHSFCAARFHLQWRRRFLRILESSKRHLSPCVPARQRWASLFTPRAIFYRFEKNLHADHISVAVVIQKMVQSEISGIAFSVHPVTEDRNQLIIEAVYGLGEAIVSGQITPDSYVVEKEPRNILDINIVSQEKGFYRTDQGGNAWKDIPHVAREKQKLTGQQILALAER